MSSIIASVSAFKHWLSVYSNSQEVEEIVTTNNDWKEFFSDLGSLDIPTEFVDILISRPFTAFFYGFERIYTTENEVAVHVVHHISKSVPMAIPFNNVEHQAYGIQGLHDDRTFVEFGSELFDRADNGLPLKTPSLAHFMEAGRNLEVLPTLSVATPTPAEIEAKVDTNGHPLPLFHSNFASLILPFLVQTFTSCPAEPKPLLKRVLIAIDTFAKENLNEEGQERLWIGCFSALQHLWLLTVSNNDTPSKYIVPKGLIPKTTTHDAAIKNMKAAESIWLIDDTTTHHSQLVAARDGTGMAQGGYNHQLQALAEQTAAVSMQNADTNAAIAQLLTNNQTSSGGSKSYTTRFHAKLRTFLAYASATGTNHALPKEPNDDYKTFLESPKSQSSHLAQHNLRNQRDASLLVDHSMVTMLYTADFINHTNDDYPRGLSIFFSVPAPVVGGTGSMSAEMLALCKETHNLTVEQIKKLSTPTIQIPSTDQGLKDTVANHVKLVDFSMGTDATIKLALQTLRTSLDTHSCAVAILVARDPTFIPGIMATVDNKVQMFLRSCTTATTTDEVSWEALDFSKEIQGIAQLMPTHGAVMVPLAVQRILDRPTRPGAGTDRGNGKRGKGENTEDGKPTGNKKPKNKRPDRTSNEKNPTPIAAWILKPGEPMGPFHKNIPSAPTANGETICIKWHILGACPHGQDCSRKGTHAPLDEATSKEMAAWIKKCRSSGN